MIYCRNTEPKSKNYNKMYFGKRNNYVGRTVTSTCPVLMTQYLHDKYLVKIYPSKRVVPPTVSQNVPQGRT